MRFTSLVDPTQHIQGVRVRILSVHSDSRGTLVELLRPDWMDVFHKWKLPFGQSYCSITNPGIARDEQLWHLHQKQEDRLVVVQGAIVLALFDAKLDSSTNGFLNLFKIGEFEVPENRFLVLVPTRVLHGFLTIGNSPSIIINFPTRLYDQSDEGRIPFDETLVRLSDERLFSWIFCETIRKGCRWQASPSRMALELAATYFDKTHLKASPDKPNIFRMSLKT